MAASEHSRSLKLGLAEWPLSGNRYFRSGSIFALAETLDDHQECRYNCPSSIVTD